MQIDKKFDMRKKLSPQSAIHRSLEPQLLCITSVKPEIVATFNEVPYDLLTRMKLKETLDRRQTTHHDEKNRRRRDTQTSRERSHERMNGHPIQNELNQLSDESDLAESPAADSIQSSYQSPIFQELKETNPCPVDGCPLNPSVRLFSFCSFFTKINFDFW